MGYLAKVKDIQPMNIQQAILGWPVTEVDLDLSKTQQDTRETLRCPDPILACGP